jgi:F-type H+-transporting ATPase subunit a
MNLATGITETMVNTMPFFASTAAEPAAEHALPLHPVAVFKVFGLPITNSMIVSWAVALILILVARISTRKIKQVPEGVQNFVEWTVEGLFNFLKDIMGQHLTSKTFWFFATIFIFILSTNWFSLIPGVGTIGWGYHTDHGFVVTRPILRGANADLNMTFAMAALFFVCWTIWALKENGISGFFLHIFGPKGDLAGFLKYFLIPIFIFAGVLETVSILFRPVSLSFRLFGNIFAGENVLEAMAKIVPWLGWLIPVPFYFLELIVGLVQALVFMLLTAVFTLVICQHEEGHGSTSSNEH